MKNPLNSVPPWLQHFLIHVVRRCLGIVNKWIDEVQEANEKLVTTYNEHNGLK